MAFNIILFLVVAATGIMDIIVGHPIFGSFVVFCACAWLEEAAKNV